MSTRPNIATFHDHEVQWLVALFCTKSELYKDYKTQRSKQDYFFARFRYFTADYYNFSGDESVYFDTVRKEAAGEANICGGGGKMSGASSRYFKSRYKAIEESRETRIDDFAKKYGVSFDTSNTDPRLFLGVTEIWNKLDRVLEIVAGSKWADVRERSYDDVSFVAPFPKNLKKELIPHDIRNRAMQKFRASKSSSRQIVALKTRPEIDEEELEFLAAKIMESAPVVPLHVVPFPVVPFPVVPFPVVPFPVVPLRGDAKLFVMPEGIDDDW